MNSISLDDHTLYTHYIKYYNYNAIIYIHNTCTKRTFASPKYVMHHFVAVACWHLKHVVTVLCPNAKHDSVWINNYIIIIMLMTLDFKLYRRNRSSIRILFIWNPCIFGHTGYIRMWML